MALAESVIMPRIVASYPVYPLTAMERVALRLSVGVPASWTFAGVTASGDYVFNGIALRYKDAKTGKFVSESELLGKRDQLAAHYQQRMEETGRAAHAAGSGATVEALSRHATNANVLNYTLGRGGIKHMTEEDWGALGEINARSRDRIAGSGFASQATIDGWSEDQRAAFAGYHAGDSVAAFEQGRASAYGVSLPAHPGDGSTMCGGHCRCRWEYASEPGPNGGFEYVAYWDATDDGKTCPTCSARGSTWAPYRTGVASGPNACAVVLPQSFATPVPGICATQPPAWAPVLPQSQADAWLAAQGGGMEGWVSVPNDYEALGVQHGQAGLAHQQVVKAGGVTIFDPDGKLVVIHPDESTALANLNAVGGDVISPLYGSQVGVVKPVVSPIKNPGNANYLLTSTANYKNIPEDQVTFEMLRLAAKKNGHDAIIWDDGSVTPLGTSGKLVVVAPDPVAPPPPPTVAPPPVVVAKTTVPTGVQPVTNGIEWQPVMTKDDALAWAGKKKDGYGVEFWATHMESETQDWAYIADNLSLNPAGVGDHMPPHNKGDVVTLAWSKDGAHVSYADAYHVPLAKPKDQPAGSADIAFVTTVKSSKIVTWPQAEKMINNGLFPHIEHDYDGFVQGVKGAGYEAFEYKPAGNKNTYLSVFDPKKVVAIHPDAPVAAGGGGGSPLVPHAPSVAGAPVSMPKVSGKVSSAPKQLDLDLTHQAAPGESVPRPVSKAARAAYEAGRLRRNTRAHLVTNRDVSGIAKRAVPAQDFIRRKNLASDKKNAKWELEPQGLIEATSRVNAKKEINKAIAGRMIDDDTAVGAAFFEADSAGGFAIGHMRGAGHEFVDALPVRLRKEYEDAEQAWVIGYNKDPKDRSTWGPTLEGQASSYARKQIASQMGPADFEELGRNLRPALKAAPTAKRAMQKIMEDRSDAYVRSWAATSYKTDLANSLQYSAQHEFDLGTVGRKVNRPTSTEHGTEAAITFKNRFTRQMYNETQARLSAAGIDRVTLFRGHGKNVEGVAKKELSQRSVQYWPDVDAKGEVMLQGISSFSSSAQVATRFWGGSGAPYLVADVPAEMILGSARTGYGCLNEEEFVVLGGRLEVSLVTDGEAYDIIKEQEKLVPQHATPAYVNLLQATGGQPILKSNHWAAPVDDPGWDGEL